MISPKLPPNGSCFRINEGMFIEFVPKLNKFNKIGIVFADWAHQGRGEVLTLDEQIRLADGINTVIAYWVGVDDYACAREWAKYRKWCLGKNYTFTSLEEFEPFVEEF